MQVSLPDVLEQPLLLVMIELVHVDPIEHGLLLLLLSLRLNMPMKQVLNPLVMLPNQHVVDLLLTSLDRRQTLLVLLLAGDVRPRHELKDSVLFV